MKNNNYKSLLDACVAAESLLDGRLLDDGSTNWEIDNLIQALVNEELEELDGEYNYYCVGIDGSVGVTKDDGVNVNWIYNAKEK